MSAKKDYIAAETTDLFIGDLRFDAIRVMNDGEYRMSQSQTLAATCVKKNFLSELESKMPDRAKILTDKGFTWVRVRVQYYDGKQFRYAETLSLSDVRILWRFLDKYYDDSKASLLIDALSDDSLRDRFDQAYGKERATTEERRKSDRVILDAACPYKALFSKQMCNIAFRWFGCRFYWNYLYHWMSVEDRCKLEENNPVIKGRRNEYIHQWLPEDVRDTLQGHARLLLVMLVQAKSKQDFQGMYERIYGEAWQPSFWD